MKKFKKWLSIALAATTFASALSLIACGDGNGDGDVVYSQYKSGTGGEYDRYEVECGTYKVTVPEANSNLYFSFWTDKEGTYSVSSSGATDTVNPKVELCYGSTHFVNLSGEGNDDKSATDKNFYFEFEVDPVYLYGARDDNGEPTLNTEHRTIFMISVDDSVVSSYPITFDVTFAYISDHVTQAPEIPLVNATTEETLSQFPERPTGASFIQVNYNAAIVYNETDRFYHVGDANGPILLLRITQAPTRFIDRPFTELNEITRDLLLYTKDEQNNSIKVDYTELLQVVYPAYCNSDGVYGVTKELRTFLERYIIESKNYGGIASNVAESKKWLGPCYYYQVEESSENS